MTTRPIRPTETFATARRFDELEAYRGIAALCVIIFHVYQYSREGLGLAEYVYAGTLQHMLFAGLHMSSIFFTLSGFLLFLPFVRAALAQSERPTVRGFLTRRLIRLLPLYYLVLLVVWAWRFNGSPEQLTDLALHLTFTHTLHPDYIFWTLGPAWSLAVEFHFYLFLACFAPLTYWLCGRLGTVAQRQALIGGLLGLIALASIALKWWGFNQPGGPSILLSYNLPAKLDTFAFGMLLALVVASHRGGIGFGPRGAWLLRLAGLSLIAGAALLETLNPLIALYHATLVSAGAVLTIASTTIGPRGSRWERVLRLPALAFIGSISYGLFLLHEPLMLELGRVGWLISPAPEAFPRNVLVVLGLALTAASLSYQLFERPCHELRHLFDRHGRMIDRYSDVALPDSASNSAGVMPQAVGQPATPARVMAAVPDQASL